MDSKRSLLNFTITSYKWDLLLVLPVFTVLLSLFVMQCSERRIREKDGEVKFNIKNAALAQEVYFIDNGTYTNSVSDLQEIMSSAEFKRIVPNNQSDNVNIAMEATATTFVITGTMTKGCKANTGTWYLSGTTETIDGLPAIDGTPCR